MYSEPEFQLKIRMKNHETINSRLEMGSRKGQYPQGGLMKMETEERREKKFKINSVVSCIVSNS